MFFFAADMQVEGPKKQQFLAAKNEMISSPSSQNYVSQNALHSFTHSCTAAGRGSREQEGDSPSPFPAYFILLPTPT